MSAGKRAGLPSLNQISELVLESKSYKAGASLRTALRKREVLKRSQG
jgi:hypothetical protein